MLVQFKGGLVQSSSLPNYLTEEQLNSLTASYQRWFDEAPDKYRKQRARHWVTYLVLRFSGARLGEVTQIDDTQDIDWRNAEIKIISLKRRRRAFRTVFLPQNVLTEASRVLVEYPQLRGKLFKVHPRVFRRLFTQRALEAGIPRELAHPHILRHSRAIEMVRAGVPLTLIQQILGHTSLLSTSIYLQIHQSEAKQILREKGLL